VAGRIRPAHRREYRGEAAALAARVRDLARRAIERLGARFDGVLRAFQPAADGRPRNTAYYTILASEWPEVERKLVQRLGGSP
jgi:hypothetical protein